MENKIYLLRIQNMMKKILPLSRFRILKKNTKFIIGLLRLQTQLGDYHQALKAIENVSLGMKTTGKWKKIQINKKWMKIFGPNCIFENNQSFFSNFFTFDEPLLMPPTVWSQPTITKRGAKLWCGNIKMLSIHFKDRFW